jgi:hypothetical protein
MVIILLFIYSTKGNINIQIIIVSKNNQVQYADAIGSLDA